MFRDNWVKWGFGSKLAPFSKSLPFYLDYSAAKADPRGRTPLALAVEAAQEIYETMPKPLTLLVSGGVDSQVMAYAFKQAGVPFRAVFARYNGGLNADDFHTAPFYRRNGIGVEILDIDIIDFHRTKLLDWATRYQNNSPHFLSHFYITSTITEGTVISSGCAVREPAIGHMSYSTFGLQRYAEISGQPMIGYFLNYSPEVIDAFYRVPLSRDDFPTTYDIKLDIYEQGGFPILRQVEKRHGFERLKAKFDDVEVSKATKLRFRSQLSKRPYDLLFRYPLHDLVTYSEASTTIYPISQDK